MAEMLMQRHHLLTALSATGVPYWLTDVHWNVYPLNNFRGWTEEEQTKLEEAAAFIGGRITYDMVRPNFSTYKAKRGRGFRVFTGSGHNTLNEENWRKLTEPILRRSV